MTRETMQHPQGVWSWAYGQLNWFRIHLLAFLLVPLMYAWTDHLRKGRYMDGCGR